MKRILFFLIICSALYSCKKDKEIIIDGNTAPPDATIPNVVKENYVNKAYISLLGRKPSDTELSSGENILNQHNLSSVDRSQMLDTILAKPGYNQRLYDICITTYLNSMDTAQITQNIQLFGYLLTQPQYQSQWAQIQIEQTKLIKLKSSVADLNAGTLDEIGLQKRATNNYFYDQINMGTENFVNSMFQHFFYRYPTDDELAHSKNMVDGFSDVVFLQTGTTKDDFITIFFGTNNYFEGQVRDLYLRFLFREPTSVESSAAASTYKTSLNYKQLQKNILSTNEYIGIK